MVLLLPTQLLFNYSIGVQAENFYSLAVQRSKYNNNNLGQFGHMVECLFTNGMALGSSPVAIT